MKIHDRAMSVLFFVVLCLMMPLLTTAQTTAEHAMQRNIVVNGDFAKLDAKQGPMRWVVPPGANVHVAAEKGNQYIRITYTQDHIPRKISQALAVSEMKSVLAIARVRCRDIQPPKESHGKLFEVILQLRDHQGKTLGWGKGVNSQTNLSDWTVVSSFSAFSLAGLTELVVTPAIMGHGGELEVDDIVVIPNVEAKDETAIVSAYRKMVEISSAESAKQEASVVYSTAQDGPLPASPWPNPSHWGKEPLEIQNPHRSQICINGAWKFAPAIQSAQDAPPKTGWGYVAVPGTWRPHVWPGVLTQGKEGFWNGLDMMALNRAWYQRTIHIPSDWNGRSIILDVGRLSTDAKVMLDGVEVGQVRWPGGEVDLTSGVRWGQDQILTLLIVATPEEGMVMRLMENASAQITQQKATLNSKGITGDIFLKCRPKGSYISDVFVKTSTRKKELALEVELSEVTQPGAATLTARLLNMNHQEEARFSQPVELKTGKTQVVTPSWIWENPRLWDLDQPNLYRLELTVRSASGIEDTYTQRFGFREFWIDGKRFFLNGTEIRLRPNLAFDIGSMFQGNGVLECFDRLIQANRDMGFNILELWPEDSDERGMLHNREGYASLCSNRGMLLMGAPVPVNRWLRQDRGKYLWEDNRKKADWETRMAMDLRRYRNEPSIVMWACTANYFGHEADQAPYRIGKSESHEDASWTRRSQIGRESMALIKKHDPTRPAFTHAGAQVGDVYTTNHYLNLIPLQEREEWLTEYDQHGTMPFTAIEFGTPFFSTMLRNRSGYAMSVVSEPWLTEFSAIYLGEESYRLEAAEYRRWLSDRYVKGQEYQSWHNHWGLFGQENFQQLLSIFNRNTWRSWRSMGITGGMLPWGLGHGFLRTEPALSEKMIESEPWQPGTRGPFLARRAAFTVSPMQSPAWRMTSCGKVLLENNGPTLAWIAGSGDEKADLTDKTHHYLTGAKVAKQAILVNDSRHQQTYQCRWSIHIQGQDQPLAQQELQGQIQPATNLFFPVVWTMPASILHQRVSGHILLQARIGSVEHVDRFDFTLFAPTISADSPTTVEVFDPIGKTRQMLAQLGYRAKEWDGRSHGQLVIVGREALSHQTQLPGDLAEFVKQGGRLVIMTQPPSWFSANTRWRIHDGLSRRMYFSDSMHPLAKYASGDDLRDWAGFSTLQTDKPVFDPQTDTANIRQMPLHGWRASNRGALSSVSIELPHRSGWRPILRGEFDMAYSPLMELDFGKGRVHVCTLDLEDHIPIDPAAGSLAKRFFDYAATTALSPRNMATIYIGNEHGRRLLDDLGVIYTEATVLNPKTELLILGPQALVNETEVRHYLQDGGKVFVLPQASGDGPLGLRRQVVNPFAGSLKIPSWPEAKGLNISDVHWRAEGAANLLKSDNGWQVDSDGLLARLPIGSGIAIACQNDPHSLPAEAKTYYRFTRWRQMRTLSQLLANLGSEFKADAQALVFRARPIQALAGSSWTWKQTLSLPSANLDKAPSEAEPDASVMALIRPSADDRSWTKLTMPAMISGFSTSDGQGVLRREIDLPADWVGKELELNLGAMDDFDRTFFNGEPVGRTDINTTKHWTAARTYRIPGHLVKAGRNVIAIVLFDRFGDGGMAGPASAMNIRPIDNRPLESYYHPDYRTDFEFGDDPYRYLRW